MSPARQFRPEWRISLLTALLLPGLLALGVWQLTRATEKQALASEYAERQARQAVAMEEVRSLDPESLSYLRVSLRGEFVSRPTVLIDNQIQHGQFGYQVVSGFRLERSDQLILVNRGWILGDSARRELPLVETPQGVVELLGHVYVSPGQPYLLAEQFVPSQWPAVMQALDTELVSQALGREVFPYPVRIEAGAPGALAVSWQAINVSPDKHRAYAFQWFAMALVLVGVYLWSAWVKSSEE